MPGVSLEKLSNWLGVTKQQTQIMLIINRLSSNKQPTSPKNICSEFQKMHGHLLQKSNLFTQIKTLLEKGFVTKEGKANYTMVPDIMKSDLLSKKDTMLSEIVQLEEMLDTLDNLFIEMSEDASDQSVEYLRKKELFEQLVLKLNHAKECYIVSKFPNVSLTPASYVKLDRGDYIETLQQRCFVKKDLKLHLLTSPGIDLPFESAVQFYDNDYEAAYKECEIVIKRLENQVIKYDNLDVRYLEHPFGFDVIIPVFDDVKEFFMFIRDEKELIQGGIHITSAKTAKRAYDRILMECTNAVRVDRDYIPTLSKNMYEDLNILYGKHVSSGSSLKSSKDSKTIHSIDSKAAIQNE